RDSFNTYTPRIPDPYYASKVLPNDSLPCTTLSPITRTPSFLSQKTRLGTVDCSTDDDLTPPSPLKRRPSLSSTSRKRSSTVGTFAYPSKGLFTPAEIPSIVPSRCTTSPKFFLPKKSPSFLQLHTPDLASSPPPYSVLPPPIPPPLPLRRTPVVSPMPSDTEDDDQDEDAIYTSSPQHRSSSSSLRQRIFGSHSPHLRDLPKPICTTPGRLCAGETETETDEPVSTPSS
ncbi:hypothetical protein BDQ17DRAFT_1354022, partial [Cyathus striatus]